MVFKILGLLVLTLAGCTLHAQLISPTWSVNLYPGACPRVFPGIARVCLDRCTSDFECKPLLEKCCSNGCGRECIGVVPRIHPGFCPALRLDQISLCLLPCRTDVDCLPTFKCCAASGCSGLTCQPAVSSVLSPNPSVILPLGR